MTDIDLRVDQGAPSFRRALWHHVMGETGDVEIDRPDAFEGAFQSRLRGDLLAVRIASSPFRYRRGPAWVRKADHDVVFINHVERGRLAGRIGDRSVVAPTGSLLLSRLLDPMELELEGAWTGLAIPKTLLDERMAWHKEFDGRVYGAGSMPALLIGPHIAALLRLGPLSQGEIARLVEASLSLMLAALGVRPQPPPARREQEVARGVRRFIAGALDDPELGAELICREFGLSRSGLKRALGNGYGLAATIRKARLHSAYHDIQAASAASSLAEIAQRWSFGGERSFRRAFGREFGFPPSRLRDRGQTPARDAMLPHDVIKISRWFHIG